MAVATPATTEVISFGNKAAVLASFAAIDDADTWDPGLTTIDAVFLTNGAHTTTFGATISGDTITFALSASLANAFVLAIGT